MVAQSQEVAATKRGLKKQKQRLQPPSGWDWSKLGLPLLACGIFVASDRLGHATPTLKPGEFDFVRFGQLPVAHEGRVKPLDTVARNSLKARRGMKR